jgi:predicted RNA-binding Zn ribbon-like protein
MARTAEQWESFRQLEWALYFAHTDVKRVDKDQLKRLAYELDMFLRKAKGVAYTGPTLDQLEKRLLPLRDGLYEHFAKIAVAEPIRVVDDKGLHDSTMSTTLVPAGDSVELIALHGMPYRQIVKSRHVDEQVYGALASHVIASGVVGGQLRKCPQCGRLFLLKIKPQPNREFHCSTTCTNRATFRRHTERQKLKEIKLITQVLREKGAGLEKQIVKELATRRKQRKE